MVEHEDRPLSARLSRDEQVPDPPGDLRAHPVPDQAAEVREPGRLEHLRHLPARVLGREKDVKTDVGGGLAYEVHQGREEGVLDSVGRAEQPVGDAASVVGDDDGTRRRARILPVGERRFPAVIPAARAERRYRQKKQNSCEPVPHGPNPWIGPRSDFPTIEPGSVDSGCASRRDSRPVLPRHPPDRGKTVRPRTLIGCFEGSDRSPPAT